MGKITFQDVGQSFQGRSIFSHRNDVVEGGCITAVCGANGSGKSTFLRLAAHLLLPTEGHVSVREAGEELRREALFRRLSLVTPEMRLYPRLSARENLDFFLGLRGVRLTDEDYEALLARVGLRGSELRDTWAGAYSTGMCQRLKLACLFASGAAFWLLDEPGANLDAEGSAMVLREARRAAERGCVVLLATNDPREEAAADEVISMA